MADWWLSFLDSGDVELGDDGQGVGEGECGDKEEVRDGRGGEGERGRESDLLRRGRELRRSRHPVALRVRSTNYTIVIKGMPYTANAFFGY